MTQIQPAQAQDVLRIATWNVELSRDGPGLLLRDILKGDPQVSAAQAHLRALSPDVVLLTGFDTDLDGQVLAAFAAELDYPYRFTRPGNSGRPTGRDLDKDGRLGEPEDAQSYGEFTGQGGVALMSRLPIEVDEIRDFSAMLWRDLPGAQIPTDYFDTHDLDVLRLASHAHWDIPVRWGEGVLHLLSYAATAPVFDGVEDRNGRRNADESRFWALYLDGQLPVPAPQAPFVIMGDSNLDPEDGDGIGAQMRDLLADPRLTDPQPPSPHGIEIANPDHRGNPALDTVDWSDPVPGNLRVDYVLPSADLKVLEAGVAWAMGGDGQNAFRHGLVWVDVAAFP